MNGFEKTQVTKNFEQAVDAMKVACMSDSTRQDGISKLDQTATGSFF